MVTTDKSLTPAMRTVETDQQWPFAISPAQLGALVARCSDVPDLAQLTRATVTLAAQEAAESLACRYPPKIAAELARSLVGGGAGTAADIRVAQAGLAGVLAGAESVDPSTVVSRVLSARQRRMNLANESHTELLRLRSVAAQDQIQAQDAELRAQRSYQAALATQLSQAETDKHAAEAALADRDAADAKQAVRARRKRIADLVLTAHALALVALVVLERWPLPVLVAVSGLLVWTRLRTWVEDGKSPFVAVLAAATPDVVTVALFAWGVLQR